MIEVAYWILFSTVLLYGLLLNQKMCGKSGVKIAEEGGNLTTENGVLLDTSSISDIIANYYDTSNTPSTVYRPSESICIDPTSLCEYIGLFGEPIIKDFLHWFQPSSIITEGTDITPFFTEVCG